MNALSKLRDWFRRLYAAWVVFETKLAAERGEIAKERLRKQHPDGIPAVVGEPYMVRLKVRDSGWNYVAWRDNKVPAPWNNRLAQNLAQIIVIPWERVEEYTYDPAARVYEVVFHCRAVPHSDFVLSLFPNQLEPLVGKTVRITKYGVVAHLLHRLLIGSDVEVYPQEWEVVKDAVRWDGR